MLNVEKIKMRMSELGLTQRNIAESMGISQSAISLKFSGARPMTVAEAEAVCSILDIPDSDFGKYFFTSKVA